MSCRPCKTCKGSGYYQPNPNSAHIKCHTCGGSGWIYEKPAPKAYTKRDLSTGKPIDTESNIVKSKSVVKKVEKDTTTFLKEYGSTWYSFDIQDTKFCTNGYAFLKLEDLKKWLPSAEIKEVNSKKAVLAFFGKMFKVTGFKKISDIVANHNAVKGVHYRINAPVSVERIPVFVQSEVQETINVVSGIKLSTKMYIDSRYKQIFNNHRFCYINPVQYDTLEWYPVIAVNNTTGKMDGAVLPVGYQVR